MLVDPIPIPDPSSKISSPIVFEIPTTKSSILNSPVLIINCSPSIIKSPRILTIPVLSPIPAGSIIIVPGPVILSLVIIILSPSGPSSNAVALTIPDTYKS